MTMLHPIITGVCYFMVLVVAVVQCSSHNNFNGPFGKHHSMKNVPSPYGCNRSLGISFPSISLPIVYSTEACDYFDYEFIETNQTIMSWQMINLRRPLEFRYYSRDKNCSGNYSFGAKSAIVQPLNYNAPEQIRLAYGDQTDHMLVSYVTNSSEYAPECQYGLDPSSLQR
ncbi:unnamed protein product [Rotaria magnacalcarata]|uniref:CUB domain-containing protein n=1 Tax=Rotaria magnacalcarata TaxID=392030 RepID=A0A816R9T4_9BILA|nr:unnamed protein product [Rotaria magnacalcarata]